LFAKVDPFNIIALLEPAPVFVVVIVELAVLKFKAPLALIKTVPEPPPTAPLTVIAPVFAIDVLPVPDCEILVTVNVVAVLTNSIFPLVVFVPLKLVTVFALLNVVPPTELVVNKPELIPTD
jgi:hypothetical protein